MRHKTEEVSRKKNTVVFLGTISFILTAALLFGMLPYIGAAKQSAVRISVPDLGERFEKQMASQGDFVPAAFAENLETVPVKQKREIRKLSDSDIIAPVPNPNNYGNTKDAAELMSWLPTQAADLLDGQSLYFSADRVRLPDTEVKYYVDDSIAVITWKELQGYAVLTFAEVKIADGSQFRRFLAGGQFGAETQYHTTEMAQTVNAVLASSGDFYKFRYNGVVVYENTVRRVNTNKADTCYINEDGDLLFTYQNNTMTQEEAQQFVDANNIRFSLTFGPVLVDNYQRCEPQNYDLGEINSFSPRAALCQLGKLHYLVVTSNAEDGYPGSLNMHQFAERIAETGCEKAYALDGGQTAAIALDGKLVNHVLYGQQRSISDIIYFATSVGDGG